MQFLFFLFWQLDSFVSICKVSLSKEGYEYFFEIFLDSSVSKADGYCILKEIYLEQSLPEQGLNSAYFNEITRQEMEEYENLDRLCLQTNFVDPLIYSIHFFHLYNITWDEI